MIIAPSPSKLLKAARNKLGLTQLDLSKLSSVSRQRISAFECGTRLPGPEEQQVLCSILGICEGQMAQANPAGRRPCFANERRRFESRYRFSVPRDRPSTVRLYGARKQYPHRVTELANRLRDRDDLEWIRVFLREAAFDSSLEFLALLHLLADGARPGWVPPQRTGFTKLPIVDPTNRHMSGHHPYPALWWEEKFLFPQVTVLTRNSLVRLDLLLGMLVKGTPHWWDVEFDGYGHYLPSDAARDEQLPLPVCRFQTEQLVSGNFLEDLRNLGPDYVVSPIQ